MAFHRVREHRQDPLRRSVMLSASRAWLLQRLTAVVVGVYVIWLIATLGWVRPYDPESWRAFWAHGGVALLTAVAWLALLLHAWIGLRDVILDYVHPLRARLTLLTVSAIGLLAAALWAFALLLDVRWAA